MDTTISAQMEHLLTEVNKFEIARSYFSDILNSQITIFSIIVAVIVALNWLYQRKINKDIVKTEVEKKAREIKAELDFDFNKKQDELIKIIAQRLDQGDNDINLLRGEVYRSMAQFWDSQNAFGTAFIWWLRASFNFHLSKDENMTRISLNTARNSLQRITSLYDIDATTGEAQTLLNNIDDSLYRLEKDLVYDAIKEIIKRTTIPRQ